MERKNWSSSNVGKIPGDIDPQPPSRPTSPAQIPRNQGGAAEQPRVPLSERDVELIIPGSGANALPDYISLPSFLRTESSLDRTWHSFVGLNDEQKTQVKTTARTIVEQTGLSSEEAKKVVGAMSETERTSLCRMFCGKHPQVFIVPHSPQPAEFIISPHCDDFKLLQRLASLMHQHSGHVGTPANLLCTAALALFDQPERAAVPLKAYCQLLMAHEAANPERADEVPPPPHSLQALVTRIQKDHPRLLDEKVVSSLVILLAKHARSNTDPILQKSLNKGSITILSNAMPYFGQSLSETADLLKGIEVLDIQTPENAEELRSQQVEEARSLADEMRTGNDKVPGIEGSLPTIVRDDTSQAWVLSSDAGKRGTIEAAPLKQYLELAVMVPGYVFADAFAAYLDYGKAKDPELFTPELIRSLWLAYASANPEDAKLALTSWLRTIGGKFSGSPKGESEPGQPIEPGALPSPEELQSLFVNVLSDEFGDGPQMDAWLQSCLNDIHADLSTRAQAQDTPTQEELNPAIAKFKEAMGAAHFGALRRLASSDAQLTYVQMCAFLPHLKQELEHGRAHPLPDRALQALVGSMLQLPREEFIEIAGLLKDVCLFHKLGDDVVNLLDASVLEARNASVSEILGPFKAQAAGQTQVTPTSPSLTNLLGATLVSRLLQRDLVDSQYSELALVCAKLPAPRPGEKLVLCTLNFFSHVIELCGTKEGQTHPGIAKLTSALNVATIAGAKEQNAIFIAGAACLAAQTFANHAVEYIMLPGADGLTGHVEPGDEYRPAVKGYFYLCIYYHFSARVMGIGEKAAAQRDAAAKLYLNSALVLVGETNMIVGAYTFPMSGYRPRVGVASCSGFILELDDVRMNSPWKEYQSAQMQPKDPVALGLYFMDHLHVTVIAGSECSGQERRERLGMPE